MQVTYGVSIACMIALFGVHEVLRWVAPWGSWLGGPGFTYKRVEDDDSGTEMKELESEGKLPWMNMRPARVLASYMIQLQWSQSAKSFFLHSNHLFW